MKLLRSSRTIAVACLSLTLLTTRGLAETPPDDSTFFIYLDDAEENYILVPPGYEIVESDEEGFFEVRYDESPGVAVQIPIEDGYFYDPVADSWWEATSDAEYTGIEYTPIDDPTEGEITRDDEAFVGYLDGGGEEWDCNTGFEDGYAEGLDDGIAKVKKNPAKYGLISATSLASLVPKVTVAARRGTSLSISLVGNWNKFTSTRTPKGWRFDSKKGVLSGKMGTNGTLTIRSSRGSASAAPVQIELKSTK